MAERTSTDTHRKVADRNLWRFRRALHNARISGNGDIEVIQRKIDDWLDYRLRHQQAGTLEHETRL
jgi:hypothetical protein